MESVRLEKTIIRIGNSSGITIPSNVMKELGVGINDVVVLEITAKKKKLSFDVEKLMTNTDFEAQRKDHVLREWTSLPIEGQEVE